MAYQGFKELKVWQMAKNLSVDIYKTTDKEKFSRDLGLKDQLRRASVSVASNIAEGYERNSNKAFIRFLCIAKGALSELRTQLEISKEINYLDKKIYLALEEFCISIGIKITRLIQSKQQK